MAQTIFINLPVHDVARSTAFYQAIGMVKDERFSNERASAMTYRDDFSVMLLHRDFYATFTPKRIIDAQTETGVLLALACPDRAAVDTITQAALDAGGREAHEAEDLGFMYSRAFEDPDGHGWGPFHMDMDAAAAAHDAPATA